MFYFISLVYDKNNSFRNGVSARNRPTRVIIYYIRRNCIIETHRRIHKSSRTAEIRETPPRTNCPKYIGRVCVQTFGRGGRRNQPISVMLCSTKEVSIRSTWECWISKICSNTALKCFNFRTDRAIRRLTLGNFCWICFGIV